MFEEMGLYFECIKSKVIYLCIGVSSDELVFQPMNIKDDGIVEKIIKVVKREKLMQYYRYDIEMNLFIEEKISQAINEYKLEKLGFVFTDTEVDEGDDIILVEYTNKDTGIVCTIIRHGEDKIGYAEIGINDKTLGHTNNINQIVELLNIINLLKTNSIHKSCL